MLLMILTLLPPLLRAVISYILFMYVLTEPIRQKQTVQALQGGNSNKPRQQQSQDKLNGE